VLPPSPPGPLGLVGGAGLLPTLMAREARAAGWRIVAFALTEPTALLPVVDRVVPLRLDDVGLALETLRSEGVRHLVFAGRVWKDGLLRAIPVVGVTRALLDQAPDWTDEGLLQTASAALEAMGVELLDQRRFLGRWLAPVGHLAGPPADPAALADARRGLEVARELARLSIGQTVVVKTGAVVAVEALEGTDETIRRGLALAGPGAAVVKAPASGHDYRFDVPAVGPETVARCAAGQARILAVEAGRVLLVDREALVAEAGRGGLTVIGLGGTAGDG
jgi:UDP-2,3-diacylglucosamine hydrolase